MKMNSPRSAQSVPTNIDVSYARTRPGTRATRPATTGRSMRNSSVYE